MSPAIAGAAASSADVCDRLRALEGTGTRTFADPNPVVWERTAGTSVWDADGRRYTDLDAGFAVASVGYCHPAVTAAIVDQAGRMTHCPSSAPSAVRAELYERLLRIAPEGLDRALVAITGSSANETAIQLARAATGRHAVIGFSGGYLGRTVGAVALAGKRGYREQLGIRAGAQFLPYPDPYRSPWAGGGDPVAAVLALLEQMVDDPASGVDRPACIVVEPIQGNGGIVVPPAGFLRGLRELADRAGAVLVFDEIQCGVGRSGRMWACEHEGVTPDLMTIGKGIGGGMALAAVLGTDALMSTWKADAVTSTFMANALNIAAGVATVDTIEQLGLVTRSEQLGARALTQLTERLATAEHVGETRGRGLFIGIELVADRDTQKPDPARAAAAVGQLRERGFLVGRGGRHGNVLKLSPALTINETDLDSGLDAVVEVVA